MLEPFAAEGSVPSPSFHTGGQVSRRPSRSSGADDDGASASVPPSTSDQTVHSLYSRSMFGPSTVSLRSPSSVTLGSSPAAGINTALPFHSACLFHGRLRAASSFDS